MEDNIIIHVGMLKYAEKNIKPVADLGYVNL
jgi:hypothetical protein